MSVRSCANMLRKHFAVFSSVCFSSVCFSAAVFAAAPAEEFEALPVTDRHFAALRQEHPRLFLPGNFDTLTSAYRDSYWGRRFGNRMLHDAEQLLAMPPLPRRMIGRRLLKTSQAEVRRIGLLATAFRLTGERRFAERARAEMLAVCAYDDWNPAHFLDVAEMTFALALGYDWLHDTLPPEERDTIASAILEKGLKPSFDKTFKQSWVAGDYNWTQVCHGGLAAGALAVYERDPQLARQVIRRAVAAMPKVMAASYRGNGAYPEGVGYWAYGTNYNTLLIEMLENAFGTGFGLADYPGLEESGEFVRACILPSGHKFACSDTGRESRVGLNYANVYLMVRRGKSGLFDRYMRNFLADYTAARPQKHHPADQRLAAPMLPLLARLPEQAATGGSTVYFSTDRAPGPVAVMRTDWSGTASALAMKGGRPSGSHGHMDSGEFVVEIDGIPVAVDLGSDHYTRLEARGVKLWDRGRRGERWKVFRLGADAHNIARFDCAEPDADGRGAAAGLIEEGGCVTAAFDLSAPYAGQVHSFLRTGTLFPDGAVEIRDHVSGAKPGAVYCWQLTTPLKVQSVAGARLTLADETGRTFTISAEPPEGAWSFFPASELQRDYDSPNPGITLVRYKLPVPAGGRVESRFWLERISASHRNELKSGIRYEYADQ